MLYPCLEYALEMVLGQRNHEVQTFPSANAEAASWCSRHSSALLFAPDSMSSTTWALNSFELYGELATVCHVTLPLGPIILQLDGDPNSGGHYSGRPRVAEAVEQFVIRMAEENPSWGYRRIQGALANLGHGIDKITVRNILPRQAISAPRPGPKVHTGLRRPAEGEPCGADHLTAAESQSQRPLRTVRALDQGGSPASYGDAGRTRAV